ncbi:hypothetical protein C8R46DRAFT_1062721 [Mycena filopes]|nr:hypothetical protein C8R46DRAFT_1062721 [Mycena filopes]
MDLSAVVSFMCFLSFTRTFTCPAPVESGCMREGGARRARPACEAALVAGIRRPSGQRVRMHSRAGLTMVIYPSPARDGRAVHAPRLLVVPPHSGFVCRYAWRPFSCGRTYISPARAAHTASSSEMRLIYSSCHFSLAYILLPFIALSFPPSSRPPSRGSLLTSPQAGRPPSPAYPSYTVPMPLPAPAPAGYATLGPGSTYVVPLIPALSGAAE